MGRNESRVAHLRALRKRAKACDVAAADISAGKETVTEMMTNLRASSASLEVKKAAEEAFRLYMETFQEANAAAELEL